MSLDCKLHIIWKKLCLADPYKRLLSLLYKKTMAFFFHEGSRASQWSVSRPTVCLYSANSSLSEAETNNTVTLHHSKTENLFEKSAFIVTYIQIALNHIFMQNKKEKMTNNGHAEFPTKF